MFNVVEIMYFGCKSEECVEIQLDVIGCVIDH